MEEAEEREREEKPFMTNLEPGRYEFTPAEFVKLTQQYDQFSIRSGDESSFAMIRVPTKWVKLEQGAAGEDFITCRDKRKRDGHLFEINGDKVTYEVTSTVGGLDGHLKSDLGEAVFYVSMWSDRGAVGK